ncbi:MAG: ACP S-malonyltransferase [Deltaproteobacteria bacterium]|nr:ACP S-malonyltransferase [Deltaproteobacteria bacterium]
MKVSSGQKAKESSNISNSSLITPRPRSLPDGRQAGAKRGGHHSSLAFIFPGQGSQYVGMGKELWYNFNIVRDIFDEAGSALGVDISRLCFEGPEEELNQTQNTQPALLTVSIAAWIVLNQETGLTPTFVAGHSLGEYTALVVAGALDFKDAVRLVSLRGRFMQEAVPPGVGAMAAILGLDREAVEDICRQVNNSIVVPANFNSPEHTVISGHREAVEEASMLAKERGAKRAVTLPVSVPSHSPLMRAASEKLTGVLADIKVDPLDIPVVTNVEAEPLTDHERVRELLVRQLYSPVRWVETILKMKELRVGKVIEIGPGKVLTGLVKRIDGGMETLNFEGKEDIQGIQKV